MMAPCRIYEDEMKLDENTSNTRDIISDGKLECPMSIVVKKHPLNPQSFVFSFVFLSTNSVAFSLPGRTREM